MPQGKTYQNETLSAGEYQDCTFSNCLFHLTDGDLTLTRCRITDGLFRLGEYGMYWTDTEWTVTDRKQNFPVGNDYVWVTYTPTHKPVVTLAKKENRTAWDCTGGGCVVAMSRHTSHQ